MGIPFSSLEKKDPSTIVVIITSFWSPIETYCGSSKSNSNLRRLFSSPADSTINPRSSVLAEFSEPRWTSNFKKLFRSNESWLNSLWLLLTWPRDPRPLLRFSKNARPATSALKYKPNSPFGSTASNASYGGSSLGGASPFEIASSLLIFLFCSLYLAFSFRRVSKTFCYISTGISSTCSITFWISLAPSSLSGLWVNSSRFMSISIPSISIVVSITMFSNVF